MRDEIYYGIKNAIERGSSLEEAAQSFVNSGYNPEEVREAVSMISQGATNIVQSVSNVPNSSEKSFPVDSKTALQQPTLAGPNQTQKIKLSEKSNKGLIIFLIIILLVLVGGIITFLMFQNQIIEVLKNII